MDSELNRIIDLFEEGKISKKEFLELVNALKEGDVRTHRRNFDRKAEKSFGKAMTNMKDTFKDAFGKMEIFMGEKTKDLEDSTVEIEADSIKNVVAFVTGGDLNVTQGDKKDISFFKSSFGGKADVDGNTLRIKVFAGTGDLTLPSTITGLKVNLTGGSMKLDGALEEFELDVKGGSAFLTLNDFQKIEVRCMGGDIELKLPKVKDATIAVKATAGDFFCQLPNDCEEKDGVYSGILGKGGDRTINGSIFGGNISIS
ncbi:hypothetical protein KAU32_01245 [bacterium]|nr:hypothetical protein [bacterium]